MEVFMGHIYREKAEIPIPNTAHVNGSNGQVSVYELDGDGHRTGVRKVTSFTLVFMRLSLVYHTQQAFTHCWTKC